MTLFYKKMQSMVGKLQLVASKKGLVAILWENDDPKRVKLNTTIEQANNSHLSTAENQLNKYFNGTLTQFTLPLDFHGTDFQKKVWAYLLTIPYGETRSYSQVAFAIGKPKAVRAVGNANRRNPISIVAPCHRVIGANGSLTGFAGGLEAKKLLLELESSQSI